MKNLNNSIILIILITLINSINSFKAKAQIKENEKLKVKIETIDDITDTLYYTNEVLGLYDKFKKIDSKNYEAEIPIKNGSQIIFIYTPGKPIPIYIDQMQEFNIKTNFKDILIMHGPNSKDSEVFGLLYNQLSSAIKSANTKGTIEQFTLDIKNTFNKADNLLKENKEIVTKSFYNYTSKFLKFQRLEYMISLAFWYRRDNPGFDIMNMPKEFSELRNELIFDETLQDETFYKSYKYAAVPSYLLDIKSIEDGQDYNNKLSKIDQTRLKYDLIKESINGIPQQQNLNIQAELYLNESNVEESKRFIGYIRNDIPKYISQDDFNKLNNILLEKIKLESGELPKFNLKGLDGKDYSFKDLVGKVVYIDFWASWCVPCRAEMKSAAPKLHAEYKDKNVVFMYINLDKNIKDANKAIEEDNINGLHIIGGAHSPNNEITKAFQVTGIPHYVLIDKKGGIYKTNAPRPSSNEIRDDLEKLLKE